MNIKNFKISHLPFILRPITKSSNVCFTIKPQSLKPLVEV